MRSPTTSVSRARVVLAASVVLAAIGGAAGLPALALDASPSSDASVPPSVAPVVVGDVAPTVAWGPLAVVRDPLRDQFDGGTEPGTVDIGPSCVTFSVAGAPTTTLVFRDWQVIWRPMSETVVLSDNSGSLATFKTGDELTLGGYSAWDDDDGAPPAPPWLVRPGPDCPTDLFLVHSASVVD